MPQPACCHKCDAAALLGNRHGCLCNLIDSCQLSLDRTMALARNAERTFLYAQPVGFDSNSLCALLPLDKPPPQGGASCKGPAQAKHLHCNSPASHSQRPCTTCVPRLNIQVSFEAKDHAGLKGVLNYEGSSQVCSVAAKLYQDFSFVLHKRQAMCQSQQRKCFCLCLTCIVICSAVVC